MTQQELWFPLFRALNVKVDHLWSASIPRLGCHKTRFFPWICFRTVFILFEEQIIEFSVGFRARLDSPPPFLSFLSSKIGFSFGVSLVSVCSFSAFPRYEEDSKAPVHNRASNLATQLWSRDCQKLPIIYSRPRFWNAQISQPSLGLIFCHNLAFRFVTWKGGSAAFYA